MKANISRERQLEREVSSLSAQLAHAQALVAEAAEHLKKDWAYFAFDMGPGSDDCHRIEAFLTSVGHPRPDPPDQPAACPACNGTRRIKVSSGVDVCPRCFPRAVDQQSVTVTESNYGLGPKCPHCGRYANSTEPQRE